MDLITTNTSSGASTSVFTSSIDSTYPLYIFVGTNIGPGTDNATLYFDASTDGGSSYGVTATNNSTRSYAYEATGNAFGYASYHLNQSDSSWTLAVSMGNAADEGSAFLLYLFNPSDTTYVKHVICQSNDVHMGDAHFKYLTNGYFNTTSAINAIKFKPSTGVFDTTIKMYGVK